MANNDASNGHSYYAAGVKFLFDGDRKLVYTGRGVDNPRDTSKMTVNDLDLGIGAYVGLVACIGATWLNDTPLLGLTALVGCVVAYAGLGALIHLRNLPSIVVTLGMSFVWLGLSVLLLPTPGGIAPDWLRALVGLKTPFVPFPIVAAAVISFGRRRRPAPRLIASSNCGLPSSASPRRAEASSSFQGELRSL